MDGMNRSGMNWDGMNRRDFAGLVAGLLAVAGGLSAQAEGQAAGTAAGGWSLLRRRLGLRRLRRGRGRGDAGADLGGLQAASGTGDAGRA